MVNKSRYKRIIAIISLTLALVTLTGCSNINIDVGAIKEKVENIEIDINPEDLNAENIGEVTTDKMLGIGEKIYKFLHPEDEENAVVDVDTNPKDVIDNNDRVTDHMCDKYCTEEIKFIYDDYVSATTNPMDLTGKKRSELMLSFKVNHLKWETPIYEFVADSGNRAIKETEIYSYYYYNKPWLGELSTDLLKASDLVVKSINKETNSIEVSSYYDESENPTRYTAYFNPYTYVANTIKVGDKVVTVGSWDTDINGNTSIYLNGIGDSSNYNPEVAEGPHQNCDTLRYCTETCSFATPEKLYKNSGLFSESTYSEMEEYYRLHGKFWPNSWESTIKDGNTVAELSRTVFYIMEFDDIAKKGLSNNSKFKPVDCAISDARINRIDIEKNEIMLSSDGIEITGYINTDTEVRGEFEVTDDVYIAGRVVALNSREAIMYITRIGAIEDIIHEKK